MLSSKSELFATLSELVISKQPMTDEVMRDIMMYVLEKDMQYETELRKWMDNVARLLPSRAGS